MPAGFKKKQYGTNPGNHQVGEPGEQTKGTPTMNDGRANLKGGAGYDGDTRDRGERIYRDHRS